MLSSATGWGGGQEKRETGEVARGSLAYPFIVSMSLMVLEGGQRRERWLAFVRNHVVPVRTVGISVYLYAKRLYEADEALVLLVGVKGLIYTISCYRRTVAFQSNG